MKAKKTKRANLENLRTIFIQIGLVIVLSLVLAAFEWNSSVENPKEYILNTNYFDDLTILPPITRPKEEIPKKLKVPVLDIKPDETVIPDDPKEYFTPEIGTNDPVDYTIKNIPEEIADEPFIVAEFMPTFKGKDASYFRNYIAKKIRFPRDSIENAISGTVFVSFIIDRSGSVRDVIIVRGVHAVIDKAVIKVIENSPKWEPGLNNGKFVDVKYTIPISFELV